MSKILAITNVKGGVGKTTTTVNLAAALVERGHKVLAVDLDPQGSLTLSFGFQPDEQTTTIRNLLNAEPAFAGELVLNSSENVDVIPANLELRHFERELESESTRIFALRYALKPLREVYDYILLDCPASAGPLTVAALAAADKVIVPLTPDYLAFQVARSLFKVIKETQQRLNPGLQVAGIYLTMYDNRTRHARDILSGLYSTYGSEVPLFSAVVRQSVRLKEAPSVGKSIIKYAPTSQAAQAYRVIAQEVEEGVRTQSTPQGITAESDAALAERVSIQAVETVAALAEGLVVPAAEPAPKTEAAVRTFAADALASPAQFTMESTARQKQPAVVAAPAPPVDFTLDPDPEPELEQAEDDETAVPEARSLTPSGAVTENKENAPAAELGTIERISSTFAVTKEELRRQGEYAVDQATNALQAGDMAQAHALYRQAIVLNPLDVRAWIGCARTSDNMPERISFAKQALKLDAENPEARDLILLTSTFVRLSEKDRWSWSPARLTSVSFGVVVALILASIVLIPQFVH